MPSWCANSHDHSLLKDLQSDLPYLLHASSTPPAIGGSFFRRLSTAPSRSLTNSHSLSTPPSRTLPDAEKDPRLAIVVSKVVKSFDPLKVKRLAWAGSLVLLTHALVSHRILLLYLRRSRGSRELMAKSWRGREKVRPPCDIIHWRFLTVFHCRTGYPA